MTEKQNLHSLMMDIDQMNGSYERSPQSPADTVQSAPSPSQLGWAMRHRSLNPSRVRFFDL
jgi:hypothetical protein